MTFPDSEEVKVVKMEKKGKTLADTLAEVLTRAREACRITSGVFECAKHLEMEPDHVMLCLLPEATPDDITMSIQHKLIEAYCLENDIHVMKVNNCEKLSQILTEKNPQQKTIKENPVAMASVDCSCVLIDWPPKGKVNKYENRLMEQIWPNQLVDLPV